MLLNAVLSGISLGAIYAITAMGLTLQYGVARIMNLAYGEMIVVGCFVAFVLFNHFQLSPLITGTLVAPAIFGLSWSIYRGMLVPLVQRAPDAGALETDSILFTFGLSFAIQGLLLVLFGGNFTSYTYLSVPVAIFGAVMAANRLIALFCSLVIGTVLWFFLTRTRSGTALRSVASDEVGASLVGVDIVRASALAFALGGAVAALGGVLFSTFITFSAQLGVTFTMKALIVVIIAGVGILPVRC
ncbi:branched-chain amino acid ABC transporter permease [Bradyrhizobium sp. ISRA442]|uniref:branched-chain amino acid ABC transporter permease n=1 Tax=Bradyrhizobium sp. ISRA442 TaxID=2866197 RepID=UPI00311AD6DA